MARFEDPTIQPRIDQIGEHGRALMVTMGDSVESGDLDTAGEAARELGQLVANLAVRALMFERAAVELAADDQETLDAIAAIAAAARLPGD